MSPVVIARSDKRNITAVKFYLFPGKLYRPVYVRARRRGKVMEVFNAHFFQLVKKITFLDGKKVIIKSGSFLPVIHKCKIFNKPEGCGNPVLSKPFKAINCQGSLGKDKNKVRPEFPASGH